MDNLSWLWMYIMKNGKDTYSKTSFKEPKHPRTGTGTFEKKSSTEEEDVSYHHKFDKSSHPTKSDGTFVKNASVLGKERYGSNK